MLSKTAPPTIVAVPVTFDTEELDSFFTERKHLPRRAGKRRKFCFLLWRRKLAEKVVRIILDYHHDALALRWKEAEALYQQVELLEFHLSRENRQHAGEYHIQIEYRIGIQPGRWRQTFHFVRDDVSSTGGLSGKLYSSGRRPIAK